MNKYGVLLGSLGTLVLVIVLGLTFTWVNAQDTKIFVPFLSGQSTQQGISAADSSEATESQTSIKPVLPSVTEIDLPVAGEIRPIPIGALPTAVPITKELEDEIRKELEKREPDRTEIFIVVGPETKGRRTLIHSIGQIDLPVDVWVDFHGRVMCSQEMVKNGDCITGLFTVIMRDNSSEELILQNGFPLFWKRQDEVKVREAYADVLALIEHAKFEETNP